MVSAVGVVTRSSRGCWASAAEMAEADEVREEDEDDEEV